MMRKASGDGIEWRSCGGEVLRQRRWSGATAAAAAVLARRAWARRERNEARGKLSRGCCLPWRVRERRGPQRRHPYVGDGERAPRGERMLPLVGAWRGRVRPSAGAGVEVGQAGFGHGPR
jgi:hypothetical protein